MIKVLVVDDSPLMRRLLTDIFTAAGDFTVATARSGAEALAMVAQVAPDVITLDVTMPGMDGLACLDRIMVERPCPVVMVSSLTSAGGAETLDALALGAVDFIAKPRGAVSLEIDALIPELVQKVRAAAAMRISPVLRLRERVRARSAGLPRLRQPGVAALMHAAPHRPATGSGVVLIGCSTGGPSALDMVLGELPGEFPWPIVVAQHLPASFTGAMARRLNKLCALGVCEVDSTMPLCAGQVYIGRGNADVRVSRRGTDLVVMNAPASAAHRWHPSVDVLVESAMRVVGPPSLIGVLMTGMGADGATAMSALYKQGGHTIAEAEETAAIWGMPGALVALGGATCITPVDQIAAALVARVMAPGDRP